MADLVGRLDGRRAHVAIDGYDGLAIALRAQRPVLLTADLAEELLVRGKTGKPLTPIGAARRLRQGLEPWTSA